jgi:hypothetical protein
MYCINTLGGGAGYKVQVADSAGGLRVVGVFSNEADARAWIAADQAANRAGRADAGGYPASNRSTSRGK